MSGVYLSEPLSIRISNLEIGFWKLKSMKRHISLLAPLGVLILLLSCKSETDDPATEETGGIGGDGDGDGDGNGDGDGDGDGTGDGDGDGDGNDCGEVEIVPEAVPPNLMLVLDKSGSMVANSWDHDGDDPDEDGLQEDGVTPASDPITRWYSLHTVADQVLNQFDTTINFGMQLFPAEEACACYDAGACPVNGTPEVGVSPQNATDILTELPAAESDSDDINGGTPATAGIVSALDHLLSLDPTQDRYILLVTDGAANCGVDADMPELLEDYDEGLPIAVADAFAQGIPTYVVGIDIVDELAGEGIDGSPEANAYEKLNEVAEAGGVANEGIDKFFNVANEDELQSALDEIAGAVQGCEMDLDPLPLPSQIPYVSFTDENQAEIPYVTDCVNEDGWTWVVEGERVEFCGTYCDSFKGGAAFDGIYGCPPPP